jgi:restriction endonuclease S subunit
VAALVLPSSIISNGGAVYVAARELLLQAFEVVAVAQLGSRTFGKTGTTTVTLFLRRLLQAPASADHYRGRVAAWFGAGANGGQPVYQDEALLLQYCQHQGWDPAAYRTLLAGEPSPELLALELFQDYERAFEKLADTKKLRASRAHLARPAAEQANELRRRLVEYLHAQEQDKLYHFVLAAAGPTPGTAPRPVVLIKSPADNAEQKRFLGYDWSGAKGNEGIQYLTADPAPKPKKAAVADGTEDAEATDELETDALENLSKLSRIQTAFYDPDDRRNLAKLNTYIEANFRGEDLPIPEALAPYLSTARLVDMLNFGRVEFDKAFSMSPRNQVTIESIWPTYKLSALVKVLGGGTPDTKRPDFWNGDIPWLSVVDFNSESRFVSTSEKAITEAGLAASSTRYLEVGDLIISARGTVGALAELAVRATFNQSCYGLRPDTSRVSSGYVYYALTEEIAQLKANATGSKFDAITTKNLDDIKIPVPPPAVQAALVAACEAVDAEVAQATAALAAREAFELPTHFDTERLGEVAHRVSDALNHQNETGEAFYVGLENIESETGRLVGQTRTPYREIKSVKTRFAPADVLYGKLRPVLNKVYLAEETGICSTDILVFRFASGNQARYYAAYFKSAAFNAQVLQTVAGQQLPRTSWDRMKAIRVPVPSPDELHAIVAGLVNAEAQLEAAQATIAAAPARKQALVREYLQTPPAG